MLLRAAGAAPERPRARGAVAGAAGPARQLPPAPLARGWNTASFERVAQTERSRIERGKPTPQLRDGAPAGIQLPTGPGSELRAAALGRLRIDGEPTSTSQ